MDMGLAAIQKGLIVSKTFSNDKAKYKYCMNIRDQSPHKFGSLY